MIKQRKISKRLLSAALACALLGNSCIGIRPETTKVKAAAKNYVSNGDFEKGNMSGFTVGGNVDYGYEVKSDAWASSPENKYLHIANNTETDYELKFSQEITVPAGVYYLSVETAGDLLGGSIDASLRTEDKEVALSVNGWDNWKEFKSTEFEVETQKSINVELTVTISSQNGGTPYIDLDNISLIQVSQLEDTSLVFDDTAVDAEVYVKKVEGLSDDFIMGADVSSILSLEEVGTRFYDFSGKNEQDIFVTMKEAGINWARIRIWNDPYTEEGNGYGAGNTDIESAVEMAKRAQAAGLKILLNFHYSDFWAHPGVQTVPKAWKDFTVSERADAIYQYTADCLQRMKDEGITEIGMIQVGNETTTKFCGSSNWSEMATMFNAGIKAIKDYDASIKTAIHFTNPERTSFMKGLADELNKQKVNYDVFATSYYPFWHGTLDNLQEVLNYVADTYDKEVMVAEVSWTWNLIEGDGHHNNVGDEATVAQYGASVQGQATAIRDVIETVSNVNNQKGIGIFYWEPAWLPLTDDSENGGLSLEEKWNQYGTGWASIYAQEYEGYDAHDDVAGYWGGSSWENQSLFDWDGVPLDSLNVFKYVYTGAKTELAVTGVERPVVKCEVGKTYKMPTKLNVTYKDLRGHDYTAKVTWNASDLAKVNTKKAGDYTVRGTLEGIDSVTAVATVRVFVNEIVKVEDAAVTTTVGGSIEYPATVKATYTDETTKEVSVAWNKDEVQKVSTDRAAAYVISGTVTDWNETVYCTVTVEGSNLIKNGSFEDTNGQYGNVRTLPNWTMLSNAGNASTRPIYAETNGGKEGYNKLSIWSDAFDNYKVEAYQEIDISKAGAGTYEVSFYSMGNIEGLSVYIQDGDNSASVLKFISCETSNEWKKYTYAVEITNGKTMTVGIKTGNVAASKWANFDEFSVRLVKSSEIASDLDELVAAASSYTSDDVNANAAGYRTFVTALESAKTVAADKNASAKSRQKAYETLYQAVLGLEFKITVVESSNGTVKASSKYQKAGEKVALTVTADLLYDLSKLYVKDTFLNNIRLEEGKFTMPASSVTVISSFSALEYETMTKTLNYYYSGTNKLAIVFDTNTAGEVDFTIGGKAGYFMTKDESNKGWYSFDVKGNYGDFTIYEITAMQNAAGTASGNLLETFSLEGKNQLYASLFSGNTYYKGGTLYHSLASVK